MVKLPKRELVLFGERIFGNLKTYLRKTMNRMFSPTHKANTFLKLAYTFNTLFHCFLVSQNQRISVSTFQQSMAKWIVLAFLLMFFFSCSTTRKLPVSETLYVGVKDMKIELPAKVKLTSTQKSAITAPLSVKPNNPLYSPYIRTPFPLGLWIYNWNIGKEKSLKGWLYRKLSKKPVLVSDVKPELRLLTVENAMKNFGFYTTHTSYEIIPHRHNPKKARVSYRVELSEPFHYGHIQLWGWTQPMDSMVQIYLRNSELKTGEQYDVNILEQERQRISDRLRNNGYYFFQPNYIEYLVDTTVELHIANVRIGLKQGIPENALRPYRIRKVEVVLDGGRGMDVFDTVRVDGVKITYQRPAVLKPNVLVRAVKVRPGQIYSAFQQSRTQADFVQLGVFKFANMTITSPDTTEQKFLDMQIKGDFALPIETEIEVDMSSKSNNLLGPGLTLGITNRNMFRRAENFYVRLTGSYEWQVGGNKQATGNSGLINSYELGLNFNLSVPRLLVPKWLQSERDRREQTHFQVGSDLLNRHNYFRMISFWGSATYDFNSSFRNYHSIVPFKLNYTYLLRTSQAFDSVVNRNASVAQSFRNQFIPSMSYTYTYDRAVSYRNPNRLFCQTSITQAGNITAGLQYLFGNHQGEGKKILNNRYSQFLKLTSEVIGYKTLDNNNQLAMRAMGGIGYAYGNSKVMPYSEQFYIGGSNSIRAFHIRSIGPGSYHPVETAYSYLDQTGDIKLEGNIEYRFKIYERIRGALFVDAGNVWLLKKETQRPGGELRIRGLLDEIALGTGAGIRYDFSYIVVRADLGVPIHAPYTTGKSGYYNITGSFWRGLVLNLAIGYPF
ncbi:MAG: BamA/TamA family outer membrane protein [Odoribacter sp.]